MLSIFSLYHTYHFLINWRLEFNQGFLFVRLRGVIVECWWSPLDVVLSSINIHVDGEAGEVGGNSELKDAHENGSSHE